MSGSSKPPPSSPHPKPCQILRKSSSASISTTSSSKPCPLKKVSKPSLKTHSSLSSENDWNRDGGGFTGFVDLQDDRQRKELQLLEESEKQSEMIFENQRLHNRELESALGLGGLDERVRDDQSRSSTSSCPFNHIKPTSNVNQRNKRSSSDGSSRGLSPLSGGASGNRKKGSSIRKKRSESSPTLPSEDQPDSFESNFEASNTLSLPPNQVKGLGLSNLSKRNSSSSQPPSSGLTLDLNFIPSTLSTIPPTPSAAAATWVDKESKTYFPPAALKTQHGSKRSRSKESTVRRSTKENRNQASRSLDLNRNSETDETTNDSEIMSSSDFNFTTASTSLHSSPIPTPRTSLTADSQYDHEGDQNHHTSDLSTFKNQNQGELSNLYYVKRNFQSLGLKIRFRLYDAKRKFTT